MQKYFNRAAVAVFCLTPLFASATVTLDTTGATDAIAAGVVAAGLIGVAMMGFSFLKRIWGKLGGR